MPSPPSEPQEATPLTIGTAPVEPAAPLPAETAAPDVVASPPAAKVTMPSAATSSTETGYPAVIAGGPAVAEPAAPPPAHAVPPTEYPDSSSRPTDVPAEADSYFTLSTGESINRRKIDPLLNQLKSAGQQPVVQKDLREMDVYRLVTGCRNTREKARQAQERLSHRIKDPFIIRDGDSYCIVMDSYLSEDGALEGQKRLARKDLPVKVVKSRVSVPAWSATSGRYNDLQEAEDVASRLAGQGITTSVRKVTRGVLQPEKERVISELTIDFEFDTSDIRPNYLNPLKDIAGYLIRSPGAYAVIEGHTDNVGTPEYNQRLSTQRALSVKNSLVEFGADKNMIFTRGFGLTKPIADNATEEGRQRNRRAVTIVIVTD
jgi:outer membrane protein OmpA-like peptidoglycan-associated protein